MIKRIYNIARSNLNHFFRQRRFEVPADITEECGGDLFNEGIFQDQIEGGFETGCQPLGAYYANLEIPLGSTREEVRAAWKRLMKKYHQNKIAIKPFPKLSFLEKTRYYQKPFNHQNNQYSTFNIQGEPIISTVVKCAEWSKKEGQNKTK